MSVYRWALGHVSYATLVADTAAVVTDFPNAAIGCGWLVETDGVISRFARRVVTPSLKAYAIGGNDTLWRFNPVNYAQFTWLMDNRFNNALSALATIMTYRSNNPSATGDAQGWVVMQCTALLESGTTPDNTENVNDRWLTNVNVRFVRGTILEVP
jgi:hypothetical protein